MSILVLDTAVVLDLDRGGLLQAVFKLDHSFLLPDLTLECELADAGLASYLRQLGLNVAELTSDEMAIAQALRQAHVDLSIYEFCSLVCSRRIGHELVSDGVALRAQARHDGIECSGLAQLLEAVHEERIVAPQILVQGLLRLGALKSGRLQQDDLQRLLADMAALVPSMKVSLKEGRSAPD